MSRWRKRRRVASGLATVAAAIALVALGPVGQARADDTVDQITGNGVTDSAVTVDYSKGLLGADNKTFSARDSTYSFMSDDFKNLKVTVGQTENLVHQAIKVSWTGGKPTQGLLPYTQDFLQLMECYGDAATGPQPENCEFGSTIKADNGRGFGNRTGSVCASHTPDTTNPPGGLGGGLPGLGCDPGEPADPSHVNQTLTNAVYDVPFIPVDTTDKIYSPPTNYPFNELNTNEIHQAQTRPDGTGELFFQALTAREASGLGCGELESDGKPRGCWLVIVPRGEYHPNGQKLADPNDNLSPFSKISESPLGAGSWSQRIQIHLDYSPLQPNCAIGSAKERPTQGTELVARAITSWQLALNANAQCKTLYGYAATSEPSNTSEIVGPSDTGLAFTTIPIGSEAVRDGGTPTTLPPLVYAPVAVSAITFGFNINLPTGDITTPVKLTPRLLAKTLTESYKQDLTNCGGVCPSGPGWVANNPAVITKDPEFADLNPVITDAVAKVNLPTVLPIAPLLTGDKSGVNQQVWTWIQADPSARDWLGGKPDENGMVINQDFLPLDLNAAPPRASFPRVDPKEGCPKPDGQHERCAVAYLPYVENYDDAASRVRGARNPAGVSSWNPDAQNGKGDWDTPDPERPGQTLLWGITDSADLATYGLVPAQMCAPDGTRCVSPSVDSVTTALNNAKPDAIGLLHVNPADPGTGGYPLVAVTYAAVRLNQDPEALKDYANLIDFAVNAGQTPGVGPGQLPHGYLPLPDKLHSQAQAAVTLLRAIANFSPSPTTATANSNDNGNTNGGDVGNNGGGTNHLPNPGTAPLVAPASASPAVPYTTTQASAVPKSGTTPAPSLGAVRWALFSVVIVGLSGSIGGPLVRFALSRTPH